MGQTTHFGARSVAPWVPRSAHWQSLANIYDTILAIVGLVDLLVFLSNVNQ